MQDNTKSADSDASERDRQEKATDELGERQETSRQGNNVFTAQPHNPRLARDNTTESVNKWVKKRLDEHENLPSQSVSWWHPHLAKVRFDSARANFHVLAES